MLADPRVTLLSDDINDFVFLDTETRALPGVPVEKGNVKTAGAHEYSRHAKVIILTYAIGDGPVKCWALEGDLSDTLHWQDAPADLKAFRERAETRGDAWFVAWNMAFDRLAMNHGMVALTRRPAIAIPMTIDAMAQGVTSGLPTDLAGAARAVGLTQKVDEGKGLIGLFCTAGGATPDSAPDEWARFIHYAEQDVAAMRDVFRATRQLPRAEWEVYWANEAINDRGLPIDRGLVKAAADMAAVYREWTGGEVRRITGEDWGVSHHVALAGWAFDRLQHIPEAVDIMVKSYDTEDGDDGEPIRTIGKVSLDRARIEKLIPLLEARDERMGLTDDEFAALELCEVKLYGAGAASAKFAKMLPMLGDDDRIRGQYVFNGAAQTGRFSSRGAQFHNAPRAWVGMEAGDPEAEVRAIDHMLDLPEEPTVHDLEQFTAAFGPAGRTLSRLIRPAILAPEGQEVVWGDYSNIEARVLPWLAASDGAERKLDIFRTTDSDPSAPDVYMIQAAATYGKRAEDVDKTERQTGKVQELSLGFGGGWRALLAMAANYRISLSREEAEPLVRAWRASNLWAVEFWSDVWRAAMLAMNNPGTAHTAGRLTYFFDGGHRGGTMFCLLPSQRLLTYPSLKYRTVEKVNEDGSTRTEEALTYMAGGARRTLWTGILCVAGDAEVATARGWVRLDHVQADDLIWDGVEFVPHEGLLFKGEQDTLSVDGINMTPDHEVLTNEGWKAGAQCEGLDRPEVRMPDGYPTGREPRAEDSSVAVPVRLRAGGAEGAHGTAEDAEPQRRPLREARHSRGKPDAWDVEAPGLCGVAVDARPLPTADASGVAQLRRARHPGGAGVGDVRAVLGGRGADVSQGVDAGPQGQRRAVLQGELPLGDVQGAVGQYPQNASGGHRAGARTDRHFKVDASVPLAPRAVYDILNCGPRRRFVVRGAAGPVIVHNCENATQAAAADLLRGSLVRIEDEMPGYLIGHTHDELIALSDSAAVEQDKRDLQELMTELPDWAEGLPVAAEVDHHEYYTKTKG